MVKSLPPDVDERDGRLRNQGGTLKKEGKYKEAESYYLAAWDNLPESKYDWDSSLSVLYSLIRLYLEWRKYREAESWAKEVFKCDPLPNDPGPYILLGKIYLEGGREDLARQYLFKAFELGGRRGFQGEDPKYLNFVLDQKMKARK